MSSAPQQSRWLVTIALMWCFTAVHAIAQSNDAYLVGVAKVDVTPDYPIRLSGFAVRKTESEGISQRIWAKAIAIGTDSDGPVILITLDNLGIRTSMVDEFAQRLAKRFPIRRDRIIVTFTHTHCAPKVNGSADHIFGESIPYEHQLHIDRYTRELTDALEKVSIEALENRQPSKLQWNVGTVAFSKNRRTVGGPVDHELPVLAIRALDGSLRAIYTTYACHCVTLSHNLISGDWAGYAAESIERRFPGATALISIGCGSDSNPISGVTGDKVDIAAAQGMQICDEVARLLEQPAKTIEGPITTTRGVIELPFDSIPTREAYQALVAKGGPAGFNATRQLEKLSRGESIADHLPYPTQTLRFGDSLCMIFLSGEVCVDYSIRLKSELDRQRIWLHGYSHDFGAYIPSERLWREGGYGAGGEAPYFALPNKLRAGLEDAIISEVKRQAPISFQSTKN